MHLLVELPNEQASISILEKVAVKISKNSNKCGYNIGTFFESTCMADRFIGKWKLGQLFLNKFAYDEKVFLIR